MGRACWELPYNRLYIGDGTGEVDAVDADDDTDDDDDNDDDDDGDDGDDDEVEGDGDGNDGTFPIGKAYQQCRKYQNHFH